MNRDIKFRAWDKNKKKMIEVGELRWTGAVKDKAEPTSPWVNKEDIELMQFTGLLDKNGKEIYEGDILNKYLGYPPRLVNWMPEGRYTGWFATDGTKDGGPKHLPIAEYLGFEVIGNIYENPELLQKGPENTNHQTERGDNHAY